MKKIILKILIGVTIFQSFILAVPKNAQAASNLDITGAAKALNTDGYLDFTNENSNVEVASDTGKFTGYVFSDDLGWIEFGTTDNSQGPVYVDLSSGYLKGKAYVLNTANYIDFGANNSNVRVEGTTFSGYVFSEDIGWIDFSDTGVSAESGFLENPIAEWGFNEGYGQTPQDSSGYDHDGVLGATTGSSTDDPAWTDESICAAGKCLQFDGGDYVGVNASATEVKTVSLWVKPITNSQSIIDLDGGSHSITASSGTITATGFSSIYVNGQSSKTLTANEWQHIVVTTGTAFDTSSATIGKVSTSYLTGFIDEVRLYPTQKSADQIKALYNAKESPKEVTANFGPGYDWMSNGLVGYWKLDETSGNAIDSSGNGYTLTNNGTTTFAGGMFGNGSEHVPASTQYFSTASTVSGVKSVSFWTNPDSNTNNYLSLTSGAYIISSSGVISATGFTDPKIYVNGSPTTSISANSWQLVTVTSDTAIDANQFYVGRVGSNYYDGTMDEIRVYQRVLSSAEISSLYNWAPSPVSYHPLDENTGTTYTYDVSGNGYTGTLTSITSESWTQGKFGSALDLDGTADFVDIGTGPTAVNTVSFWVKPTTTSEHFVDLNGSAYISASSGTVSATGFTSPTYYINGVVTSSPTISANTWTHVAVTTTTSLSASDYDIGRLEGTDYLDGTIDEVKLYNYTRTPAQIVTDMNANHPAPGSPIGSAYVHYSLDEGYGTTAHNSGNGGSSLDATITSGTWSNSGKYGKTITFTASTSIADTISDPGYDNTISLWVYPTTSAANKILVTSGKLTTDSSSCPVYGGCTGSALSLNTWTHIVAVSNGSSSCAIYQDGILTSSGTTGVTFGTSLNIGASNFTGNIDEFKLYTSAMTSEQAKVEFNAGQSAVFGSLSTDSSLNPSYSSDYSYCPPGQGSACSAPVGEWKLDENTGTTIYDTSGNGYNVNTFDNGLSASSWSMGKVGGGLYYNNPTSVQDTQCAYKSTAGAPNPSTISISAWVKPRIDERPTGGNIVTYMDSGEPSRIYMFGDVEYGKLFFKYGGSTQHEYRTTDIVLTSNWNHVTVNFTYGTGSSMQMYVNGIKVTGSWTTNDGSLSKPTAIASDRLTIGGTYSTTFACGYGYYGTIDNVRIFDYARTPAQIAWDYNRGAPLTQYDFDECSGTTLYDVAPKPNKTDSGYNGTITEGGSGTNSAGVGTCLVSAATMWNGGSSGKYSSSLEFDGTDDYVSVSDTANLRFDDSTSDFSLFAWVKRGTTGAVHTIVSKEDADNDGYRLLINADDTITCSQDGTDITSALTVSDTNWHNIGCVIDRNGTSTVYLDGKAAKSQVLSADAMATTAALTIGTRSYTATNYMNGQIDDIRIYNYPLTAEQIKILYNENSSVNLR